MHARFCATRVRKWIVGKSYRFFFIFAPHAVKYLLKRTLQRFTSPCAVGEDNYETYMNGISTRNSSRESSKTEVEINVK